MGSSVSGPYMGSSSESNAGIQRMNTATAHLHAHNGIEIVVLTTVQCIGHWHIAAKAAVCILKMRGEQGKCQCGLTVPAVLNCRT
jgi:hypothetical protein